MIRVKARPEPATFDLGVRQPGALWIAANPTRKKGEKIPPHWRKCIPELRASYKGICAYFCCHVEEVTGASSADHFVAKSSDRRLIYEWDNYRFACSRMNSRKSDASDVLDPFFLTDGWFELKFGTMSVHPRKGLTKIYGLSAQRLMENAPFIAMEAARQGFLRPADAGVTVTSIRAWLDS